MTTKNNKRWLFTCGTCLTALAFPLIFIETSPPVLGQQSPPNTPAENRKKDQTAKEKDSAPLSAVPVTIAKVEIQSIQRTVDVVGSFEGYEELSVTPKVDGRVIRVHCDVGDIVRPGDVLIEIDPTDYKLAVEEGKNLWNRNWRKSA